MKMKEGSETLEDNTKHAYQKTMKIHLLTRTWSKVLDINYRSHFINPKNSSRTHYQNKEGTALVSGPLPAFCFGKANAEGGSHKKVKMILIPTNYVL